MAERLPAATVNAMVTTIATATDAGAGAGTIKVYSGAQPATADDVATGTLLVTFTLNDPAWGAGSPGVINLVTTPAISATASASGTAGWFRLADSTGATVLDGACGTSGQELNLNTLSITGGNTVTVNSFSVTQPSS